MSSCLRRSVPSNDLQQYSCLLTRCELLSIPWVLGKAKIYHHHHPISTVISILKFYSSLLYSAVQINTCFCTYPLCELCFHNRRSDHTEDSMSNPDPFQELVDNLRWVLVSSSPPPRTSVTNTTTSSAPLIASPIARPAPFSGVAEECNGFLLLCSLALEMQPHLYPTERSKIAFISDRPIFIFYKRYRYRLFVRLCNRYAEPIFIYCYKVNK